HLLGGPRLVGDRLLRRHEGDLRERPDEGGLAGRERARDHDLDRGDVHGRAAYRSFTPEISRRMRVLFSPADFGVGGASSSGSAATSVSSSSGTVGAAGGSRACAPSVAAGVPAAAI